MKDILEKFADIILDSYIITDKNDQKIFEFKARITFKDSSFLEFTEIKVHDIFKRKYSFQWMSKDFELIIRWDNALHHRKIATFPHHKHIGNDSVVEPSDEPTLEDILAEIQKQLM